MRKKYFLIITAVIIGVYLLFTFGRYWYWHYYWDTATPQQRTYLPKLDPCYVPSDIAVDGISAAQVLSWEDVNGNGFRETNESALSNVIVLLAPISYPYDSNDPPISQDTAEISANTDYEFLQITNEAGSSSITVFKPGCSCKCWEGDAIFAWSPPSYESTTPTHVELAQDNQIVTFGFRKIR